MAAQPEVTLLEDARWDAERECVVVTALVAGEGAPRYVPCAVSLEALESRVTTPSPADPLRLLRDFETEVATAVARKVSAQAPEIVITSRDLKRV
ncbi:DUF1488 family protein [Ferruginivarius sediminum]|nr:DUF1488 family protein [Ferruginivarius sediminum]